jgi:hypothetical protein
MSRPVYDDERVSHALDIVRRQAAQREARTARLESGGDMTPEDLRALADEIRERQGGITA